MKQKGMLKNLIEKKKLFALMIILVLTFFIGTGFQKRTDVVLVDYAVSDDGTELILDVGVFSSMGYTRGFSNHGGGIKPHYLTFYATFGGVNSKFAAKDTFILEIDSDDTEVYFNRADGGFELVLVKNEETGQWIRPDDLI